MALKAMARGEGMVGDATGKVKTAVNNKIVTPANHIEVFLVYIGVGHQEEYRP
jgi:hypothetical protein